MYIREIPVNDRSEVKEIMKRNESVLLMPRPDLERLFYLYYRYIKVLQKGEDLQKRIKNDLSCIACKGKVILYFRNIIQDWG
jgi:hypothetical protein